jgi:glycosyltransferase involved in cell wall biosynthesis
VRARDAGFRFPPVSVIPHGVDPSVFYPLARPPAPPAWAPDPLHADVHAARIRARRLLFPDRDDLDTAFIVLNANRNRPSKRIDVTLRGFALFARGKPANVMLFLHMGTATPAPGHAPLADALGIRDRLLVSAVGERHPEASSKRLNLIYNACDVGVNTSEGEGWGLVSFEHAATGAAQIVPRHSACAELWAETALLVDPVTEDRADGYCCAGLTVTPEGVADALERLYCDTSLRRELSLAAYANATRVDRQWGEIARNWDRHFRSLLAP